MQRTMERLGESADVFEGLDGGGEFDYMGYGMSVIYEGLVALSLM